VSVLFYLDPLVLVKVDIFSDQLLSFRKSGFLELAKIFFFEMAKEVLHWRIVPALPRRGYGTGTSIGNVPTNLIPAMTLHPKLFR